MPEPESTMENTAVVHKKRRNRPSVAIGKWLLHRIERALIRYSTVADRPIFNSDDFTWTGLLEADWKKIRVELDRILQNQDKLPNFQDISRDQINITQDDRWKTFFLYGYGYKMQSNCDLCPETTRIIESIPGMMTGFFSVLAPGKHIPPHRGPYKGLLRCHLALKVPEPAELCWIKVGDRSATWKEGKCLVFDDTYVHQVENNTDGTRVVLFLDIIRPMRFPGSLLNSIVLRLIRMSPFIQDAIKNQRAWEYRIGS
jgi:aspartyl/asparaginyl beta-hydroxylase (cupin superfamily)